MAIEDTGAPAASSTLSRVGLVYGLALLLTVCLFYLHTSVLFDMAQALTQAVGRIEALVGTQRVGKAIVLAVFCTLFVAHVAEAAIWALFLRWHGLVGSYVDGLYYVGATVTTLGYGDLILPSPWRQLGPLVAIAGVLKFGCSTAVLFVIMQTVWVDRL